MKRKLEPDYTCSFPLELHYHYLSYLSTLETILARRVCKEWKRRIDGFRERFTELYLGTEFGVLFYGRDTFPQRQSLRLSATLDSVLDQPYWKNHLERLYLAGLCFWNAIGCLPSLPKTTKVVLSVEYGQRPSPKGDGLEVSRGLDARDVEALGESLEALYISGIDGDSLALLCERFSEYVRTRVRLGVDVAAPANWHNTRSLQMADSRLRVLSAFKCLDYCMGNYLPYSRYIDLWDTSLNFPTRAEWKIVSANSGDYIIPPRTRLWPSLEYLRIAGKLTDSVMQELCERLKGQTSLKWLIFQLKIVLRNQEDQEGLVRLLNSVPKSVEWLSIVYPPLVVSDEQMEKVEMMPNVRVLVIKNQPVIGSLHSLIRRMPGLESIGLISTVGEDKEIYCSSLFQDSPVDIYLHIYPRGCTWDGMLSPMSKFGFKGFHFTVLLASTVLNDKRSIFIKHPLSKEYVRVESEDVENCKLDLDAKTFVIPHSFS